MTVQDKTGWILACASGLACVAGSSIICLDLVCRQVPRWKHFSIRESTTFLSASLSLSFGVMFYSALYAMLPKAHSYFLSAFSSSAAAYITIGAFLTGVAGLQLVSDLLHRLLPSSIVNCEEHAGGIKKHTESHSHPERSSEDALESGSHHHHHLHHHHHHHRATETTPLLAPQQLPQPLTRKPSIKQKITGLVKCNADGTCYGFTDHMCEQKCDPARILEIIDGESEREVVVVTAEGSQEGLNEIVEECSHESGSGHRHCGGHGGHEHSHVHRNPELDTNGHHHVVKNKFLSIGVQTSIAIALHKIPEGFITYATNHANPSLGFTVFLALFIHNIAEGFIMSLPLFLALKSRLKAIVCASLLGGLSQPLGAGIAALSIHSGGAGEDEGGVGYGVLFAVTAGIMGSVGVQLFSQAVQLKHGSRVPFVFGFIGMGLLGVSFALTADH